MFLSHTCDQMSSRQEAHKNTTAADTEVSIPLQGASEEPPTVTQRVVNFRRYGKLAIICIILVLVATSSTIPLATKVSIADTLGSVLLTQLQHLPVALAIGTHNYTTLEPAREAIKVT